jgi:hypothetical protein
MTIPAPTYLSVAELKSSTKITALAALSDGDLTYLLQTAEDTIDAYVGRQRHHPDDENTDRVFPRAMDEENDAPVIPYLVSRACLRQVEWLYTQWWPTSATEELPVEHDLESESIGGDGSYSYKRARLDLSAASLSPQARALLSDFRSRSAGIAIGRVSRLTSLSSRE